MAHFEPMDIDDINSEFDNKENSFHHNNVLPKTPSMEKGYEEMNVSELSMKLRYSITPTSSPMSKSLNSNCQDYKNGNSTNDSVNFTYSLVSTLNDNDKMKSSKALPPLASSDHMLDNRSVSVLHPLDSSIISNENNLTGSVTKASGLGGNDSLPSTSSSADQTPEATTPTKEISIPNDNGGSPIMRGIKSVLNMFRSSQSPITPLKAQDPSQPEMTHSDNQKLLDKNDSKPQMVSTPIASKSREGSSSKRSSPYKECVTFNDDLERELQWKDETTIIFKDEKIPIHKLFLKQTPVLPSNTGQSSDEKLKEEENQNQNSSIVQYMDISNNNNTLGEKSFEHSCIKSDALSATTSDSEFLDCETTFNNNNRESQVESQNIKEGNCVTIQLPFTDSKQLEEGNEDVSSNHESQNNFAEMQSISKENKIIDILTDTKTNFTENDEKKETNDKINNFKHKEGSLGMQETESCATVEQTVPQNVANVMEIDQESASDCFETYQVSQESHEIEILKEINLNIVDTIQETKETQEVLSNNIHQSQPEDDVFESQTVNSIANTSLPIQQNLEISDFKIEGVVDGYLDEVNQVTKTPVTMDISNDICLNFVNVNYQKIDINLNQQDGNFIEEKNSDLLTTCEQVDEHSHMVIGQNELHPEIGLNNIKQPEGKEDKIYNVNTNFVQEPIVTDIYKVDKENKTGELVGREVIKEVNADFNKDNCLKAEEILKVLIRDTPHPCKIGEDDKDNTTIYQIAKPEIVPEKIQDISLDNKMIENYGEVVSQEKQKANSDDMELNATVIPIIMNSSVVNICTENYSINGQESSNNAKIITISDNTYEVTLSGELNEPIDSLQSNNVSENQSMIIEHQSHTSEDLTDVEKIMEIEKNTTYTDITKDENPFATKTKVAISPPLSPKITSTRYSCTFDEISIPFVTKSKIRTSPPPEQVSTNQHCSISGNTKDQKLKNAKKDLNRRKSLPEVRKPNVTQSQMNSSLVVDCSSLPIEFLRENKIILEESSKPQIDIKNDYIESGTSSINVTDCEVISNTTSDSGTIIINTSIEIPDDSKSRIKDVCEVNSSINKTIKDINAVTVHDQVHDDIDQLIEFQASVPKNVFNLPEISSEVNLNPFKSKSNICQSTPQSLDSEGFESEYGSFKPQKPGDCVVQTIDDKEILELSTFSDKVGNCSYIPLSKAINEKNDSVSETNTEDEDTVEGPFYESDEFKDIDKSSDLRDEDDDMMHFSNIPSQGNDDNIDSDEMFIDAEAFEFLLNQNKSNIVLDSGKESLFLKFDPLYAKRISLDSSSKNIALSNRQSTLKRISKSPAIKDSYCNTLSPGPSHSNNMFEVNNTLEPNNEDDPNITVTKPMMIVTPAVNSIVSPRNKFHTPAKMNRHSLTFTSPAMAVIDKLLSLSSNNSMLDLETTVTQVGRNTDADLALTQLRELLAEKEIYNHQLRVESKALADRLNTLESQIQTLDVETEKRSNKVEELNMCLTEKTNINKSMETVVEEYERTIATLIAEKEQDKKRHSVERMKLIKERDEQNSHLCSMEASFSDLLTKFERNKQIVFSYKANQDKYIKSINKLEQTQIKLQNNYELLKQHATSKLNIANQEFENLHRSHEADVCKLNAMIKKKEVYITSLEVTYAQKTKANEELTAICEELISKVG